jgi:hypothetical protein
MSAAQDCPSCVKLQAELDEYREKTYALIRAVRGNCEYCPHVLISDEVEPCKSCGEDDMGWSFDYARFKEPKKGEA